jgi:hypothetical protein
MSKSLGGAPNSKALIALSSVAKSFVDDLVATGGWVGGWVGAESGAGWVGTEGWCWVGVSGCHEFSRRLGGHRWVAGAVRVLDGFRGGR